MPPIPKFRQIEYTSIFIKETVLKNFRLSYTVTALNTRNEVFRVPERRDVSIKYRDSQHFTTSVSEKMVQATGHPIHGENIIRSKCKRVPTMPGGLQTSPQLWTPVCETLNTHTQSPPVKSCAPGKYLEDTLWKYQENCLIQKNKGRLGTKRLK